MKKQVTYQQGERGKSFDRSSFYPGDIPAKAGVYVFRDRFGRIIYVGKAADLRKRMSSYFQPSRQKTADPKLRSLIKSIHTYEYYPVKNESESLVLESRLIKEYSPRYNVLMRDDKRFLLVKINTEELFPGLRLARVRKNDGCRYFGPFPKSGALRKTVDFLVKRFKLRVCRPEIPTETDRKHCLARIVKDCCEPCVGKTSREEYLERVRALMEVLDGKVKEIVEEIRLKMGECVAKRQYEKAAEFRDVADNIEEIFGNRNRSFRFAKVAGAGNADEALQGLQSVLDLPEPPRWIECFDISNIGGSLAVAGMVCFIDGKPDNSKYRRFRIRGQKPEVGGRRTEDGGRRSEDGRRKTEDGGRRTEVGGQRTEDGRRKTEDGGRRSEVSKEEYPITKGREEDNEHRTSNIEHSTSNEGDVERRILKTPDYPMGRGGDDFAMMAEAVSRRYGRLLEDGERKPEVGGQRSEVGGQRTEDGGRRSEVGGRKPEVGGRRTEVGGRRSEVGGQRSEGGGRRTEVGGRRAEVGGQRTEVSKEEYPISKGREEDNEHRTSNIEHSTSNEDDVEHRILKSSNDQALPDLIIVDGGKGQLGAAIKALRKISSPFIPIIGLAKKNEEIFVPGRDRAIILDRHSPVLKLLQAIRDESHRFAVAYHRELRNSRIEESMLDDIPGIGPERKKALLKGFGSLKKLRKATPEEIMKKVPGIGAKFAEIICRNLS